jgi:hypothetical protein
LKVVPWYHCFIPHMPFGNASSIYLSSKGFDSTPHSPRDYISQHFQLEVAIVDDKLFIQKKGLFSNKN